MSKIGLRIRLSRFVSITLMCACCSGCIALPVRVPTKTISVSGAPGKKLDLNFIKVGSTTREDVVQKLGWVDTGVKDDRFFVGRWADSSWGLAWAAGGGYSGAAGWNRAWTTRNLILAFDEQGVTQQMSIVSDKDLANALSERISKGPSRSLDLAMPIEVSVEYIHSGNHVLGRLILDRGEFKFLQNKGTVSKVAYDFKTSPDNLSRLTTGNRGASHSSHPENLIATVYFKQKTSVGSKFTVQLDVPTTVILLLYMRETQPGSPLVAGCLGGREDCI